MALAAWLGMAVPAHAALPPVRHVFVIVLENKGYDETFGQASQAPYLASTLTSQGALIQNYYGIGHQSLDNYIAMVSGQAPNVQTQADCQIFTEFLPAIPASDGQFMGQGCVYPQSVQTVANQLEAKGLSWKGYMGDMGTPCRHPDINAPDSTQEAHVGDQYAARHNPFVYFHSIIDTPSCAQNDVDLSHLSADIASPSTTPAYAFITPNLCDDGHDEPCVDGAPGGLKSADEFLKRVVPEILSSPGYQDNGMLVVTFDEAESGDATACCNEQPGPNTPNPGGPTPGPGGGRTGTVVISPFTKAGTVVTTPYNHYSFLRTVEDLFGLDHLGYAGQSGLAGFGDDVFNQPAGAPTGNRTPATQRARALRLKVRPRTLRRGKRTTLHMAVNARAALRLGGRCRHAVRRTRANKRLSWRIRVPRKRGACTLTATRSGWSSAKVRLPVR